jgi:hypothetical protein
LESRLESLEITLEEINPHIIILSEHDMKFYEIDRVNIGNYKINSCYCRVNANKGGVMILSKEHIKWAQVALPLAESLREEKIFEFCATRFIVNNFKFTVVGLYRSPSSDVDDFLDRLSSLISELMKKSTNIVLAGDINIDVLRRDHKYKKLKNVLKSFNMNYMVNFPTRIFQNSTSAIDNFLTNLKKDQILVSGVATLLSDHDGQILELLNKGKINDIQNHVKELKSDFCLENKRLFEKFLREETWISVYNSQSNKKFDTFMNIFNYYYNLSFPKKYFKINKKVNKWLTESLKEEKNEVLELCKQARNSKDKSLFRYFWNRNKIFKKRY